MRSYQVLIKQLQSQIEVKQKEIALAYKDQEGLEYQIEYLKESLEKEHVTASMYKHFMNPKYFERVGNKIEAYMHLSRSKNEEIDRLQSQVRELFAERKKYDVLLQGAVNRKRKERLKKESEGLEDLYRPRYED